MRPLSSLDIKTLPQLITLCGVTACLLVATSIRLNGQQPQPLSLNQATNLAISNNPEIRQISWQIEKAESNGYQKSRLTNPQFGSLANEIGNDGQAGQYGFFLQRNIVRNNRVELIQNETQWKIRSLDSLSKIRQRKVARQTANYFIQIEFIHRQIKLQSQRKNELGNFKKLVDELIRAGELSPLALAKLDVEIETVHQEIDSLKYDLDSQRALLQTDIGKDDSAVLDFDFDDEVESVLRSSLERDFDVDSHPAMIQVADQIEAQKWLYQVAKSRQLPDWVVQTSVNFDAATDDLFGGFQFNIPWQVNDRKEGLISSEAAQIQILNETRNQIRLSLRRKVIILGQRRQSLIRQIQSIGNAIIPKVDEVATQTSKLFHAGEIDFKNAKDAVMESFLWRVRKLELSRDLLLVEAEAETLTIE